MNLRTLILSITILVTNLANGQEPYKTRSYEWNAEKQRAWDILRTEFPEYTSTDSALRETYGWIQQWDAWAKVNDPELYDNPMKPLIYARRQKAAEIESAAKTEQQSAAEEEERKALTQEAPNDRQSAIIQKLPSNESREEPFKDNPELSSVVERHNLPSPNLKAIWLGSAIILSVTFGVAWGLHQIIRPRRGVISATALGRKWAAWMVAIATITMLPAFFRKLDDDAIALWAIAAFGWGILAFFIGWIIGLFKFRKKDGEEPSPAFSLPTTEKPPTVVTAIKLLYFTIGIGVLRCFLEWPVNIQTMPPSFVIFVQGFTLGLLTWIIYKLDQGRIWARTTYLVLLIVGIPFSIIPLVSSFAHSPFSGVLGVAQFVFQVTALILIFKKSACQWFLCSSKNFTPPPLAELLAANAQKDYVNRMPAVQATDQLSISQDAKNKAQRLPLIMNNIKFEVEIPEGVKLENGYVEMRHNTQYSLILKNHPWVPCDAEVVIDGIHVGTWRIESRGEIRIERPVHDTGHFTFFQVGTEEAEIAGITKHPDNGLISVTFKPQKEVESLKTATLSPSVSAGATGLTGESQQRFREASEIEHDMSRAFTIHIRLISKQLNIRPLAPRSTPIPPPVG